MINWENHSVKFECDDYNGDMLKYSPWSGHRFFIYDYVTNEKPSRIVELGSYYGSSAFAILQAIKDEKLKTEFNAVDTWEGDDFTSHDYEENIYESYSKINQCCFGELNSHILKMTFDEAVNQFEDNSIDLLHIDGSHHYDDVKHDYLTWRKKVNSNGVVMFHDISEDKVDGKIMGSHQFWEELKSQEALTYEFDFSFGLGILFFNEQKYEDFKKAVNMSYYQRINNALSVEYKDVIRKKHFELIDKTKWIENLKNDKKTMEKDTDRLLNVIEEKDNWIHELENNKSSLSEDIKRLQNIIEEKDKWIHELENDKSAMSKDIERLLNDISKIKADYENTIEGKDNYITELLKELEIKRNNKVKK